MYKIEVNKDLHLDYPKFPPFPVVNGECGAEFKVNDVFGYFIHYVVRESGSEYTELVTRVESLTDVKSYIESPEFEKYGITKITRRFFWDLNGKVVDDTIYVGDPITGELTKSVECDRSRIFKFDMHYLYSLNAEFFANRYGGKVLSEDAKWQKQEMANQSEMSELDGWMEAIYEAGTDPCLSFEMVSEYDSQFNRRDASNMIKIPEDAICGDILNINDARNYFVSNRKLRSSDESESLYVKITLINYWM